MTYVVRTTLLSMLLLLAAGPAMAGLLTLSIVSGLAPIEGAGPIEDPVARETLSGTTLTQLGTPMLYDPEIASMLGLVVRITNTSDAAIEFPDLFTGVSVLASVFGIPGYASETNLANEGETATTGVEGNRIAVRGASGEELGDALAGLILDPGEFLDIPNFVWITAFERSSSEATIAFGFDLPTFRSGGRSVTTGAWSGAFTGPSPPSPPPTAVPEPTAWLTALAGLIAGGGLRRARGERRDDGTRERG